MPRANVLKPLWPFTLDRAHDQAETLVAWYPGIAPGTTQLRDMNWRKNHGTLTNFAAPFTPTSGWGAGYQGGKGALVFDGTDDYVLLSGSAGFLGNSAAFSISLWFKSSSATTQRLYAEASTAAIAPISSILLLNTGAVQFSVRDDASTTGTVTSSATTFGDGKWHHVVATQSSKSARALYVDGQSVGTDTTTVGTLTLNNSVLGTLHRTPAAADTQFMLGSIEDLRLYSSSISAAREANIFRYPWAQRYQPRRFTGYGFPSAATTGSMFFGF